MSENANREYAPHQQRVIDEANELKDKFSKLGVFILDSPTYQTLYDIEQQDLAEQHTVMEKYISILDRRISRF